ncbi:hypothetical protein DIPPA_51510 [Diplonema papillatum]|nr:hypothetical protein DIPPA_51510 [Diplonema papillatum]
MRWKDCKISDCCNVLFGPVERLLYNAGDDDLERLRKDVASKMAIVLLILSSYASSTVYIDGINLYIICAFVQLVAMGSTLVYMLSTSSFTSLCAFCQCLGDFGPRLHGGCEQ